MEIQRIMRIMDASSGTRRIIERSLHEIDRRALNAMVLVKRHGNKLASYGVVAQAFRPVSSGRPCSASTQSRNTSYAMPTRATPAPFRIA